MPEELRPIGEVSDGNVFLRENTEDKSLVQEKENTSEKTESESNPENKQEADL